MDSVKELRIVVVDENSLGGRLMREKAEPRSLKASGLETG